MATPLPPDLRCFRHMRRFLARNLPRGKSSIAAADDDEINGPVVYAPAGEMWQDSLAAATTERSKTPPLLVSGRTGEDFSPASERTAPHSSRSNAGGGGGGTGEGSPSLVSSPVTKAREFRDADALEENYGSGFTIPPRPLQRSGSPALSPRNVPAASGKGQARVASPGRPSRQQFQQRCVSTYFVISRPVTKNAPAAAASAAAAASPTGDSERQTVASKRFAGQYRRLQTSTRATSLEDGKCLGATGPATEDGSVIYRSEVCVGSQHPEWKEIPEDVIARYGSITQFVFSLYYCTGNATTPDQERDTLYYEMLIDTTHTRFLAKNLVEVSQHPNLPYHVDNGQHSLVILMHCVDGILFPLHQGIEVMDEPSGSTDVSTNPNISVPYSTPTITTSNAAATTTTSSQSASGCAAVAPITRPRTSSQFVLIGSTGDTGEVTAVDAPDYLLRGNGAAHHITHGVGNRMAAVSERATLGDMKALSTASLAWEYLREVIASRREATRNAVDKRLDDNSGAVMDSVESSLLEVRLAQARAAQASKKKEIADLRQRVTDERRKIQSQEAELEDCDCKQKELEQKIKRRAKDINDIHIISSAVQKAVQLERNKLTQQVRELFPVVEVSDASIGEPSVAYFGYDRNTSNVVFRRRPFAGESNRSRHNSVKSDGTPAPNGVPTTVFICGHAIPNYVDDISISMSSADTVNEYAAVAGYVAHALVTLAAVHGCTLPHPLIVAGSRSRVLERPGTEAVVGGSQEQSLPLFATRHSDRFSMKIAFDLLREDAQHVARVIRKNKPYRGPPTLGHHLASVLSNGVEDPVSEESSTFIANIATA